MTAMKILHLGKYMPPPYGGIEAYTVALLSKLKNDVEVDLVVTNTSLEFDSILWDGVRVYKLPRWCVVASTPLCPSMPFFLRKLFKKNKYDIVHIHLPNPMAHLASLFLPSECKVVVTWHSDIIEQKYLYKLYAPFLQKLLRRASAIVSHTPYHFDSSSQIDTNLFKKKLHTVPHGINVSEFGLNVDMQNKLQDIKMTYEGRKVIFALGRHVHYKGFEYLIEAMRNLENCVLLLGGTGPLTDRLKKMVSQFGLSDRVQFLGKVPDAMLPLYYHLADVFVLPSITKNEAYGVVQLEAMACGKPVISCDLKNGVNYVNQNGITGLVVPPRDVQMLANAIGMLLSDCAMATRMGKEGYKRVTQEFSLDLMKNKMLRVYEQVRK